MKSAVIATTVATSFKTLRDMCPENVIHPGCLEKIRDLGEGAFAAVEKHWYRPAHGDKYLVAVKRLKADVTAQKADFAAFVKEVSLLRKLKNKHIVHYIGVGSSDSTTEQSAAQTMFLVQEYMNAGNLKRLVQNQMLSLPRRLYSYVSALRWSLQIANGLAYLHNSHPMVIHRDLKLDNVLLKGSSATDFEAKLADFGLSTLIRVGGNVTVRVKVCELRNDKLSAQWEQKLLRSVSKGESGDLKLRLDAQKPGGVAALMYVAPEALQNAAYTEKVDVYSFGVVMFELFHSCLMYGIVTTKGTPEEVEEYVKRVCEGYYPPCRDYLPSSLCQLIDDCRSLNPASRPSMNQVVERLQEIQKSGELEALDASTAPPRCSCVIS